MLILFLSIFISQPVYSSEDGFIQKCQDLKTSHPKISSKMTSHICNDFESFYITTQDKKTELFSNKLYIEDSTLGIVHPKNVSIRHHYYLEKDDPIYNVTYKLDPFGKRETPQIINRNSSSHLLLFGGSFTFGIGVEDDQTIAAYINKLQSKYKAYNFAVGGTAIHHSIDIINKTKLKEEIVENKGIGVYIFIDDHVNRVAGRGIWSSVFTGLAYYYLKGEKLLKNSNFRTGRKFTTLLHGLLYKSFKTNISKFTSKDDLKLMCKLTIKAKKDFKKKFKNSSFYFLFHSFSNTKSQVQKDLAHCLKKNEVNILNFSRPNEFNQNEWFHVDNHPKPKANKWIANFLIKSLNL
jgi:hypothetical protein